MFVGLVGVGLVLVLAGSSVNMLALVLVSLGLFVVVLDSVFPRSYYSSRSVVGLVTQGGWSPILLFFSVRLLLNHDKNTSSNPHFLLLLYIQNILVKSIQFGWCFYSIPYNEKMWVTAGVFVMI